MVKLTPDLIQKSMQFINPVRDRELDLRGYKIPVIENLGATLDQFDTIDFSDNDIHKLGGFPLLKRLSCLFLHNNRIVRISEGLEESLPNLETLMLTSNSIQELSDIDVLAKLPKIQNLCLLYNPVQTKQYYRQYIIFRLPTLRVLDFQKIKKKEREEVEKLFKSKKGKEILKEAAARAKTSVQPPSTNIQGPSAEELWKIREAINKASSLEEVERLTRLLQAGQIPGKGISDNGEMEVDGRNGR